MSLGVIAFIMSSVSVTGCSFIVPSEDILCPSTAGLFKIGNDCLSSKCMAYPTSILNDLPGSGKAARAMGATAATFGGIVWVTCRFMLIFKFPLWLFKTVGGVFCFCFVTQMLTLVAFLDCREVTCSVGKDAIIGIVAAIFYLGIGITILVCPVPKTAVIGCCGDCCKDGCDEGGCRCCGEESAEAVNNGVETTKSFVTETYNVDGSVTVKEEKLNTDGSKTTTVTTRRSQSV